MNNEELENLRFLVSRMKPSRSPTDIKLLKACTSETEQNAVELLVEAENKVSFTVKDDFGNTALIYAARKGWGECVEEMLKRIKTDDITAEETVSAFIGACAFGHHDIALLFAKKGVPCGIKGNEETDKLGVNALNFAVQKQWKHVAQTILNLMTRDELQSPEAGFAFTTACSSDNEDMALLFAKRLIRPDVRDHLGNNVLDYVAKKDWPDVSRQLKNNELLANRESFQPSTAVAAASSTQASSSSQGQQKSLKSLTI